MLEQIGSGIAAGITFALSGFFKSKGEPFDYTRFGATIALGAGIGVIYGIAGIPFDVTMSYATQLGAIAIIENALKAIWRRLIKTE